MSTHDTNPAPRFTEGPWEVDDDGDVCAAHGPGWMIAHAPDFWEYDNGEKTLVREPGAPSAEECSANARLIAQAPAMHDLLVEISEILGSTRVYGTPSRIEIVGSKGCIERLLRIGPKVGKVLREVRGG